MTELYDALRAFVHKYVRTVSELEVLLWLQQHAQRTWNADEIAREMRGNPTAAADYLRHFVRAGLARENGIGQYQYVEDSTTHGLITDLAQAYVERPVSVVDLIYAQPSNPIQLLADAFKIKKD